MIKCVIFDNDGTLVQSEPLGHKCMEQQLAKYGYEVSRLKMEKLYRGWKLQEIIDDVAKSFENLSLPENFIPEYRAALDVIFENELQPSPGIEELLGNLELPVCLASSGPIAKIKTTLRVTGLEKYFGDRLFSAYEIGSWKPNPRLFLVAAESMGFEPEECLVVEDSEVGVEAALAAQMKVIHYNPEHISIPFEVPSISHFSELAAKIESLREIT